MGTGSSMSPVTLWVTVLGDAVTTLSAAGAVLPRQVCAPLTSGDQRLSETSDWVLSIWGETLGSVAVTLAILDF